MWCRVELCCDDTGRKLPRREWRPVGSGRLEIGPGGGHLAGGMVASILARKHPADRHEQQLAWPLSDVRVRTYSTGLLVIGLQAVAEGGAVREVRQAWYCTAGGEPKV